MAELPLSIVGLPSCWRWCCSHHHVANVGVGITVGWGLGAGIACSQDLKYEKKKKKVAAYRGCWCWHITMAWKGEEDTGV